MHFHISGTLVAIVAIIAFFRYQRDRMRAGLPPIEFGRRRGLRASRYDQPYGELPASPREAELEREVARLTERIQVLERIATDGRREHDLAREIESLRDPK